MGVKFITREQAAALITDDSTVVTTGFVECSNPEALESALGERFEKQDLLKFNLVSCGRTGRWRL